MLRGFLVENQACCYCTMRALSLARVALASDPLGEDRSKSVELQGREKSGAPRTRTLDTDEGATVFKTASSARRTRSVCEMAPPLGIAPSSHRLTGGPHTLCVERNVVLPAGFSPASSRLEDGCLIRSATGALMKWSRTSVLPRVSPDPKSGGFAVSLVRELITGGLCGHCSRDLPLDRRLLFVAELIGQNGGLCR